MTTPEVPATNDPIPSDIQQAVAVLTKCIGNETAAWNTWNNINTDSGFVSAFMRLHGPAEIPADAGTLFTPRTDHIRSGFATEFGGTGIDQQKLIWFDRWFATELQKARAEAALEALGKVRQRMRIVSPYGHEITESMAQRQVGGTISDIESEYRAGGAS